MFSAIKDIQSKYNDTLTLEQQKVLENEVRDFKLGGCGLSNVDKKTLEELNVEARELFIEHGGKSFQYIPCLNDNKFSITFLNNLIKENLQGW